MQAQTPCGLVTLLTDFGLQDPFVGVMKGVLFGAHRELRVIDVGKVAGEEGFEPSIS